jgi:hypothetical protein
MCMMRGPLAALILSLGVILPAGAAPVRAQTVVPGYTPGEESPEEYPPGPGRDETFYACIACHNFKLVAAQGMSRQRWDDTLDFMTSRHGMPEIEGADRALILDYLAATYPERTPPQRGWQNPFAK